MNKSHQPWTQDQAYLLPPSLGDWLPEDHWRGLSSMWSRNWTRARSRGRFSRKTPRGQRPYHPSMMVALLVYAYCTGVYSSRRIERACHEDVAFRVMTGVRAAVLHHDQRVPPGAPRALRGVVRAGAEAVPDRVLNPLPPPSTDAHRPFDSDGRGARPSSPRLPPGSSRPLECRRTSAPGSPTMTEQCGKSVTKLRAKQQRFTQTSSVGIRRGSICSRIDSDCLQARRRQAVRKHDEVVDVRISSRWCEQARRLVRQMIDPVGQLLRRRVASTSRIREPVAGHLLNRGVNPGQLRFGRIDDFEAGIYEPIGDDDFGRSRCGNEAMEEGAEKGARLESGRCRVRGKVENTHRPRPRIEPTRSRAGDWRAIRESRIDAAVPVLAG